jgi:hypothetical protein
MKPKFDFFRQREPEPQTKPVAADVALSRERVPEDLRPFLDGIAEILVEQYLRTRKGGQ